MLFWDKQKITNVAGILIGVVIIIIGFIVIGTDIDKHTTSIGRDIKFGADFYTEMYGVTQDVGFAINSAQRNICAAIESVCRAIGWLIFAIGAFDTLYFAFKLFDSSAYISYTSYAKNVQSSGLRTAKTTDDKWICTCCKTENSMNLGQCEKCGTFRGIN